MKVTLEFDGFEERDEALMAQTAGSAFGMLIEIDNLCRDQVKYGPKYKDIESFATAIRSLMRQVPMVVAGMGL